jgi:hypothetical protein
MGRPAPRLVVAYRRRKARAVGASANARARGTTSRQPPATTAGHAWYRTLRTSILLPGGLERLPLLRPAPYPEVPPTATLAITARLAAPVLASDTDPVAASGEWQPVAEARPIWPSGTPRKQAFPPARGRRQGEAEMSYADWRTSTGPLGRRDVRHADRRQRRLSGRTSGSLRTRIDGSPAGDATYDAPRRVDPSMPTLDISRRWIDRPASGHQPKTRPCGDVKVAKRAQPGPPPPTLAVLGC